ncbi:TonB-dependent receptor [Salinimicrobium tongyeongense]|uniref:TonB-dependent receptor n=1 Tax=Salinimicrobium tongyeongense TaxID=2809707 RepID=A0ABY6NUW7_9FLAO|nr:TonB-dependent receptor [Salinimicrobium tongyeongense]UZH56356.1 TonB-dependent receptor [Salinimicrobium tongyeongense]
MRLLLITAAVLLSFTGLLAQENHPTGSIAGKLTDKEMQGEPLPFANVLVKGTGTGATTNVNGLFEIENLEPGNYTIAFSFIGYEQLEVSNVKVESGKVTEINTELGTTASSLDEVVISTVSRADSEVALLLEQKNAIAIKQAIGSEELDRKGINTVEQGLSKISGISMAEDRGIFVRGLDDRYNFLMMNGLPVASSDPDFKIIPLSYIATNIVSYIDVYKTFSPSLYQDFAGATFNVNTITAPSKPVTTLNIGVNYNTNATFEDYRMDKSSELEYLGYTGSSRKLPSSASQSSSPFSTSWTPETITAPLATTFGITHGQRLLSDNEQTLGLYLGVNYRNSYEKNKGVERTLNSEGTAGQDFTTTTYNFSTRKSALLALDYHSFDKLKLNFNTIYLQNTSNFIREAYGRNDGFTQLNNKDFFIRDIRYTQNDMLTFQLLGDLEWDNKKHQLHFGGSAGLGNNNIPDRRLLRAAGTGEDAEYITTNGINPFRFYQELENVSYNSRLEYELGIQRKEDNTFSTRIKAGHNFDGINYDFFTRTITAQVNSADLPNLNTNDPEAFFQQGFAEGFLQYSGNFSPTSPDIQVDQFIHAGYFIFLKEWDDILLDIGVRAEYAPGEIIYKKPLDTKFSRIIYKPFDLSPSLNLKYNLNATSNLRLASSVTTTRPRMREILPSVYQDGDGNQVIGNPDLLNSRNYNLDLKYELFPTSQEVFAITVFAKYLDDPIERLARATSVGYRTYFDNFDEAVLYGIEAEARFKAGSLFKNAIFDRLSVGFNGILMDSKATAEESNPRFAAVTHKNRKLQGASNWGINADLLYQIFKQGNTESSLNLIYNSFGKRIYAVGVEGADEIYEKPINQFDLVWATQFNKNWGLKLTARNLLHEETKFFQDPTREIRFPEKFSNTIESFDTGTTYGASLTYKF